MTVKHGIALRIGTGIEGFEDWLLMTKIVRSENLRYQITSLEFNCCLTYVEGVQRRNDCVRLSLNQNGKGARLSHLTVLILK